MPSGYKADGSHSGRAPGTPNKSTIPVRKLVDELCGENWDPVAAMCYMAKYGELPKYDPVTKELVGYAELTTRDQIDMHKEVAPYLRARRMRGELSGPDDSPLELSIKMADDKASKALADMMKSLPELIDEE